MTVELEALTVCIGDDLIVSDASLIVGDDERVAIMGPSGAGKSTLLRAIAGLLDPVSGRILVDGVDHTHVPPHQRRIGLMFQDYALFPHLDVASNVGYGLRMAGIGMPERRQRIDELLALVGLEAHADRRIDGLSGGEQQRVALARTLAPRPDVVLLDEPLGSLDQSLKEDLLVQTRAILARLGIPALYVTHDRLEAEAFADRIAIMRGGRLLRVGTPEHLWREPQTEFIARFMGHRNVIDGSLVGRPGRVVVMDRAIATDATGPIEGRVTACAFQDGRYSATMAVGPEILTFHTPERVEVGHTVSVSIDPAGIVDLAVETDDSSPFRGASG